MARRSKVLDAVSNKERDVETILLKRCVLGDELARWAYADWLEERGRAEEAFEVRKAAGVVPFDVIVPRKKQEAETWASYQKYLAGFLGDIGDITVAQLRHLVEHREFIRHDGGWFSHEVGQEDYPFFIGFLRPDRPVTGTLCRCGGTSFGVKWTGHSVIHECLACKASSENPF